MFEAVYVRSHWLMVCDDGVEWMGEVLKGHQDCEWMMFAVSVYVNTIWEQVLFGN